jgi:serine protease Do
MTAEEIYAQFRSRILVITCDLSADEQGRASGVLVSEDGYVVTNAHVVEACRSVAATRVTENARTPYRAALKYYDKESDTAVLKIEGRGFGFFTLLVRTAHVGEPVYAIGNPRGLEQTITPGIVSGLRNDEGTALIQHSAPISLGSSGGALVSSRGELLGINAFLLKDSQNLNFAVPSASCWQPFPARERYRAP